MRFVAYGRTLDVLREGDAWLVLEVSGDGKRRVSDDVVLPPDLGEADVERHLADLLHEWARPGHDEVRRLD